MPQEYKFKPKVTSFRTKTGEVATDEGADWQKYTAMFIRGATALSPGGLIGAGVGGLGEGLAQTIEGRDEYNFPQIATQSALGAVPFGKATSLIRGASKGALMGSTGTALTQQAEEGLHVPTPRDIRQIGTGAVLGSAGGSVGNKLANGIFNKKAILDTPIPKVVPKAIEPIVFKPKKGRIEAPRIRTSDTSVGHTILDEIKKGPTTIPKVDAQLPNDSMPPSGFLPRTKEGKISLTGVANLPKGPASSADLSAPLRQGIFLMGRGAWWESWKPMVKAIKTSNYEKEVAKLVAHPRFGEAQEAGVKFTSAGSLDAGEEQFASSLASKIPLIGEYIIKPSERAYTTFLNSLRMGVYNDLITKAERLKIPVPKENIANYVNTASGRGNIGLSIGHTSKSGERAAELLNTFFFSPRFIASRVQLLNPVSYIRLDPFTRMEALRDLGTLTTVASSVLGLAKLGGAEVTFDPRETDFGKIKLGDTRIDALGGFGQYIRLFSQVGNQIAKGEGGPDLKRFMESKVSPAVRIALEVSSGKDYFGRDISIPRSVLNAFTPMIVQDIVQLAKDDPELLPIVAPLSMFGVSSQTYGNRARANSTGMPKIRKFKP